MDKLIVVKALAVAGLCTVGLAAPAAILVMNQQMELGAPSPSRAAPAIRALEVAPQALTPPTTLVALDGAVISAQIPHPPARTGAADALTADALTDSGERHCRDQASETFASTGIRVCDVERTAVHRGSGVFGALEKPTQLSPRDLPSPSGLLTAR